MCEPCEKLQSNRDLLTEYSEKKFPSDCVSLRQKFKFSKFEDCHYHFCDFSKNQLDLKAKDNEISNVKTGSEVKSDKPEFEDCLKSIKALNVGSCNPESAEIDHSKFFLLTEDFSIEEINKKFQELNFAFKMDFSTIENRLCILCRIKNQAEINLEKEFQSFKLRLQNFQFLFESANLCSKDRLSLILDLNRGINFLENAVTQFTEIAIAYGYIQHEAEFLKFIFIMVENVKNIEKIKNKALKIAETFKAATESAIRKDWDVYPLRRRSFSVSSLESCLRRTEFAESPPRIPAIFTYIKENLSFTKIDRESDKNLIKAKDFTDDPIKLCKNNFGSSKNISKKANFQDQCSPEVTEPLVFAKRYNTDKSETINSNQFKDSLKDFTQSLTVEESRNIFFCLRKIFKWNMTLLSATRFRWPENSFQYASFYVTWYIVFVLLLFFMGGLFTGFNGCLIYASFQYSFYWLAVFTAYILIRRFSRFLIHFFFVIILALIMFFVVLTKIILPQLTELETNALLKIFGLIFEVRYFNGPPPI